MPLPEGGLNNWGVLSTPYPPTGSTKGALTMLTKAMAMELGPHKVGTGAWAHT